MIRFDVNRATCIACGACAADCPTKVISLEHGYPEITNEAHCMKCQHCLAICPTGALSILGNKPEDSTLLSGNLPDPEHLKTLLKGRRSFRAYQQVNVDPALLQEVLDTAWHAPTGVNAQPLLISLVDDIKTLSALREEIYQRLQDMKDTLVVRHEHSRALLQKAPDLWAQGKADVIFRRAPHFVVASALRTAPCPEQDPLIFLSYFELMAQSRGLGTVWCGLLTYCLKYLMPDLKQRLGISNDYDLSYTMLFGYPGIRYMRTVNRGHANIVRYSI